MAPTNLSIYRPEDEALLGLLDAYECSVPGTLDRADADAAIARHLSSLPVKARVDTVCSVLAGLEAQFQGCDTQLMRVRQAKARIERSIDHVKNQLALAMSTLGVKRLAGTVENIVLHTNPEAVQFTDERLIPPEYQTLHITMTVAAWHDIADLLADTGNDKLLNEITTDIPVPKKSLIKPVLKAGGGVPGAFLDRGITVVRK